MGKTRSKFLTLLVIFSMIMSMGVSFGAKEVGTEEEILEDPTGKLNIMIDDDALVDLGLTMTLTHEDGESFEVPTDGNKWQDAPYGEYDVVLNLSSDDVLESFYVVVRQKGKPNETYNTPTFTINASAATVFLEKMEIVLGEPDPTEAAYKVEHYTETGYGTGLYE
ncbi:MAG: hypothetical protein NUK57_03200, partial [Gudongella sp.]|nr:hypothetical protein [Gudongella sp.]